MIYTAAMKTLAELHTYWRDQFDTLNTHDNTSLKSFRLLAWLSFQLPLALDTSAAFFQHIGEHWYDAVHKIMQYRFDNIMKATVTEQGLVGGHWEIENVALIALNEAGAKVLSSPSHLEKNPNKIEAYKQQKTVLQQFLHSFFTYATNLVAYKIQPEEQKIERMKRCIATVQCNTQRSNEVIEKAQSILHRGGFASIGVTYDVSNETALEAMNTLLLSMALGEKAGLPQTIAGLDGCNLQFRKDNERLGTFSTTGNSIYLSVDNDEPTTFWHEWMHMLEERVLWTTSLEQCPAQWAKYRQLAPDLVRISTSICTTHDPNVSELYFNDPFSELTVYVDVLCEEKWFHATAGNALCDELKNQTHHPIYNMEVFKNILRTNESSEQRDSQMIDVCNQWRNEEEEYGFDHDFSMGAQYYDTQTTYRLHFEELKHYSNFIRAAKVLDRDRASAYWSNPKELLARGFESFVGDMWMLKQHTFNVRYPQGQEREDVVQAFGFFMDAFKSVWTNVQDTTYVSIPLIKPSVEQRNVEPIKKRLTRF